MADIQYLNYGDLQIELLALLTSLANNVLSYVAKLSWSNKRKEKFMSAYSDIMNKGLKGASNNSGQWTIDVGDTIDLDSKSKKDREMYLEAAYFIQQQMSKLPTKSSLEKKDESELPKYDSFFNNFTNYLSLTYYGGNPIRTQEDWNILDERNPNTGLRGTDKRVKRLSDYLKAYSNSLEEGKYNFEGSPFKDLTDLKTRINNAITKLDDGTWNLDDADALNAIGLRSSDWFNNGSGDTFIADDGKEYTYGNYYGKILPTLKKAEAKALAAKQKAAQQAAYQNTLFYKTLKANFQGTTALQLKEKYGGDLNQLIAALNLYSQSNARDLNPDLKRELFGAMKLAKDNVSDDVYKKLIKLPTYRGSARNRFKVIRGVDNYIYDIKTGNVIQVLNRELFENGNTSNLFSGVKTIKELLQEYLKNTDFTDADWAELGGIVGDIASIINPEPISAGITGVAAAGARNYARTRGPEKWGFTDYLSLGFDYLTGGIGAIPGLGDAILGAKVAKNVLPWLRRAMRVPAFLDLWNSTPELVPIGKKLTNGESLTVQDWMNLGTFFRGLATTRNLNVQNRASRKALLERGYEVSNRLDKRLGLTQTKPIGESVLPVVKMKINGKEEEIPISAETKAKLDKELSKKGNDVEARSKVIREDAEVQAAAEKAGIKVKEKVTDADGKVTEKISDDWNNSSVNYNNSVLNSLRNARLFKNKIGLTPKWVRTSGETFGEISNPINRGYDNFENYVNSSRGMWDRFKYGSNKTLKGMDRYNLSFYGVTSPSLVNGILYSGELNLKDLQSLNNAFNPPSRKTSRSSKMISPKNSTTNGKLVDGTNYLVQFGKNSTTGEQEMFFIINGESTKVEGTTLGEMKKNLGKLLNEINLNVQNLNKVVYKVDDPKWKEFVKSIKELKQKGFLYKQGGTIDKQKIQRYKEFIKK